MDPLPGREPGLAGSILLILPYGHFAFSRADVNHLAQGVFPFLIACFILIFRRPRLEAGLFGLVLMLSGALVMLPVHPGWQCYVNENCDEVDIAGDVVSVNPYVASNLEMLYTLKKDLEEQGELFVAPLWPGAYAVLEQRSPVWEVYALFGRSEDFQKKEILRLQEANPGLVLIYDYALDGRDELRYVNTHPLVMEYIFHNYDASGANMLNPSYQLFVPKRIVEA